MNKAEIIAFELLKKRGYEEEDIIYQGTKNPDFICTDGKRFEVKRIYGRNELLFTQKQMKELQNDDKILVINTEIKKLSDEFLWSEAQKQSRFIIKIMKYPNRRLQITISDRIYGIIEREAKKGDKRIFTFAGMLLAEAVDAKDKE
ncbi:MAG: hypothetical protein H8D26_05195, partial [Methanomicrobia archaeon]|nr:hypothetical protein [Methanomicrobia archaeon]